MTSNIYHNWDEEPISKITKTLIDYRGKTPEKTDSGVRLITAKVIKEGFIQEGNDEYISEDTYKEWMTRGFPQKEDILITTEAPLGEVAQLRTDEKIAIAQRIILLRGKEKIINQKYYYYVLRSYLVQKRIESYGTGTTVLGIKQKQLKKVLVPLPPKPIQDGIVFILSKIDDLLEINKNKIKVLEEMAQLLYREWFVELRFPGYEKHRFVDSELGKIPEGWKVGTLGDLVYEVKNTTRRGKHLENKPYVPIDRIDSKSFTLKNYDSWKEAQSSLLLFEKDDILFGAMRPYFHKVAIAPYSGVTRSTCLILRPTQGKYQLYFSLLTIFQDEFIDHASLVSQGSTIPYAVWNGVLEKTEIIVPNKEILISFNEVIEPLVNLAFLLSEQNKVLATSRDLLLPKLMSGEIDVSKLDINITEN